MKTFRLMIITLFCMAGATSFSFAQMNTEDAIELARSETTAIRQAAIASNINFSEEESKLFWPVYKDYRGVVSEVNDRLVRLIKKYAENYESLSDELASDLMIEYLDIEEDKLILKQLYTEKLLDVLPPAKVARVFQLENKMDATLKMELALIIPFAEPKEE